MQIHLDVWTFQKCCSVQINFFPGGCLVSELLTWTRKWFSLVEWLMEETSAKRYCMEFFYLLMVYLAFVSRYFSSMLRQERGAKLSHWKRNDMATPSPKSTLTLLVVYLCLYRRREELLEWCPVRNSNRSSLWDVRKYIWNKRRLVGGLVLFSRYKGYIVLQCTFKKGLRVYKMLFMRRAQG